MAGGWDRRDFFKAGAAAAAALAARNLGAEVPSGDTPGPASAPRASEPPAPAVWNPATARAMPTRNLGRTGHRVGIFSLGGQAALEKPDNEPLALAIINRALDLGVNYLDTSARYGGENRWSEQYFGRVMRHRRKEAFLATKTHDRTRDGSLRLLETSLHLLRTDHVDLWQLHAMGSMEDVDQVCAKGGALEAFQRAREQGMVRFLGLSGHADPDVLAEAIRRFPFDTVLMGINAADPHHRSFRKELLPLALDRGMGVIGMKIPARGRILSTWTPPPPDPKRPGKPLRPGTITIKEALDYVLSQPVSTVILGVDNVAQLEEDVAIASAFTPLSEARQRDLEARTREIADQALWFRKP